MQSPLLHGCQYLTPEVLRFLFGFVPALLPLVDEGRADRPQNSAIATAPRWRADVVSRVEFDRVLGSCLYNHLLPALADRRFHRRQKPGADIDPCRTKDQGSGELAAA